MHLEKLFSAKHDKAFASCWQESASVIMQVLKSSLHFAEEEERKRIKILGYCPLRPQVRSFPLMPGFCLLAVLPESKSASHMRSFLVPVKVPESRTNRGAHTLTQESKKIFVLLFESFLRHHSQAILGHVVWRWVFPLPDPLPLSSSSDTASVFMARGQRPLSIHSFFSFLSNAFCFRLLQSNSPTNLPSLDLSHSDFSLFPFLLFLCSAFYFGSLSWR